MSSKKFSNEHENENQSEYEKNLKKAITKRDNILSEMSAAIENYIDHGNDLFAIMYDSIEKLKDNIDQFYAPKELQEVKRNVLDVIDNLKEEVEKLEKDVLNYDLDLLDGILPADTEERMESIRDKVDNLQTNRQSIKKGCIAFGSYEPNEKKHLSQEERFERDI